MFKRRLYKRHSFSNIADLYYSLINGTTRGLSDYIKHKGDVNLLGPQGRSLISTFVAKNDTEKVKVLLDAGCDVNSADSDGTRPLHVAVRTENYQLADSLLKAKASLDIYSAEDDLNPLMLAAENSNIELVALIVSYDNTSVNLYNHKLETALHKAVSSNSKQIVRLLLKHGAAIWADSTGITPLTIAFRRDMFDLADTLVLYCRNKSDLVYHVQWAIVRADVKAACLLVKYSLEPFSKFHFLHPFWGEKERKTFLEVVKYVAQRYSQSTKCSCHNKILLKILDMCEESRRHRDYTKIGKQLAEMLIESLSILIQHGLMIHSSTDLIRAPEGSDTRKYIKQALVSSGQPPVACLKLQCCNVIRYCLAEKIEPIQVNILPIPKLMKEYICSGGV